VQEVAAPGEEEEDEEEEAADDKGELFFCFTYSHTVAVQFPSLLCV